MSEELRGVAWLRRQVEIDRAAARDIIESEAADAVWIEPTSGVLQTGAPTHDDTWAGTFAIGDSRLTRFIASHDPQDIIADCDSRLAALDLCERVIGEDAGKHGGCSAVDAWSALAVARLALGLLAARYRHRDGYREEWKP